MQKSLATLFAFGLSLWSSSALAQGDASSALSFITNAENYFAYDFRTDEIAGSPATVALSKGSLALAERDLTAAETYLDTALEQASTAQDADLERLALGLKIFLLNLQGRTDDIARLAEILDQPPPQLLQSIALQRAFPPTARQATTPLLANVIKETGDVVIDATAGGTPVRLLIDTGADGTVVDDGRHDSAGFISAETAVEVGTLYKADLETRLGVLPMLEIGGTVLTNRAAISLLRPNLFANYFEKARIVVLLGMPEIEALGGLIIESAEGELTGARFFKPQAGLAKGQDLRLLQNTPIIGVGIGGRDYACLFDTGAHRSRIGADVFDAHKLSLGLKKISRKKLRKSGVRHDDAKDGGVAMLPITVGTQSISLENVILAKSTSRSNYCFIGNDAIRATGGVTMDFANLRIAFGPDSQGSSRSDQPGAVQASD